MITKMYETLEFNKILDMLADQAVSCTAAARLKKLEPCLSEAEVNRHLNETTEARAIMECHGNPPLSNMEDLEKSLSLVGKGGFLVPEQLLKVAQFLTACRRLKAYLKKAENSSVSVAPYGNSIYALTNIEEEINNTIFANQVCDNASSLLSNIRRKIARSGEQIKMKLDSLLRNNKACFSDGFVSIRGGHYTLPVKKEYKAKIPGTVVDVSQSGNTYFIEPESARKLQDEIALLNIREENEVRRILYSLTALIEEYLPSIRINMEAMECLDFIFAKSKLSIDMKAVSPVVSTQRSMEIKAARHPLLNTGKIIPLDFHMGGDIRGIVITGPNTGGKTVALKTIGLLSLMAQSGLHVPCEYGHFSMSNYVLCDIGDGQSISENLSTFSSHITNIIKILKIADNQSLVLLDELGSGTDPAEGMGLAAAIIEELIDIKCLFVATTHYPEIKDLANSIPGLVNARMTFDRQTLMPLYKLEIGTAGESCALYIAERLGLPDRLIQRAKAAAYGGSRDMRVTGPIASVNAAEQKEKATRRIKPERPKVPPKSTHSTSFNLGDCVMVYPRKELGIVYRTANERGEIGVQVKKKKFLVNHKRIRLHIPADKLYPEDYDFSIIFDSVAKRKINHAMSKKYNPKLIIEEMPEGDI